MCVCRLPIVLEMSFCKDGRINGTHYLDVTDASELKDGDKFTAIEKPSDSFSSVCIVKF